MPALRADRRVERTRQALLRAFVELLLSEDLEHVTVAAIVARADVGRSTFYTHFRGRDDILKASLTFSSAPLARIVGEPALDAAALLPLLDHFRGQRRLARAFTQGALRRLWASRLAEMMAPDVAALARRPRARPLLPVALVSLEVAELQIALIVHWLAAREPVPPQAVAEALIALTGAAVAALLPRSA